MSTTKANELYEVMGEILKLADQLEPLLSTNNVERLMALPRAIRLHLNSPELKAKIEATSDEELDIGITHSLAALQEMKNNLSIAMLNASGALSDKTH
jgi:hypothetical protein